MPRHLQPPGLYQVTTKTVASLLFTSCRSLDNETIETEMDDIKEESLLSSPRKTPKSPSKEEVMLQISPSHKPVLSWLSHLPDRVVEDVIRELLARLETHLLEDMDNKLILTLINIEKMKINDFYFGLHSLFSIIQGFQLESLQFSKRLWYCLAQYGEITSCRHLTRTLCSAMPGLPGLTRLNVSHVATDQLCLAISRWLPALVSLDLSNSSVTDKAVRYVAGTGSLTQGGRRPPSASAIRNLSCLLDLDSPEAAVPPAQSVLQTQARARAGCCRLERLSLQSCEGVTERGVIVALEHLEALHHLDYHQKFSMLEILIRWTSNHQNSERMMKLFRLTELEHGFPYSLSPLDSQLTDLAMLLPRLTSLTLVTTDSTAAQLVQFSRLQRITLELEDFLGEGFLDLLTRLGPQLLEVNVSCSSDPDLSVTLDLAGPSGQQAQLFNAALVAAGQLCPRVTKVSITGCGLVSSAAVARLDLEALLASPGLMRRTVAANGGWFRELASLILMSYDDTHPTMTVHSGLLRSALGAATNLRVLNLEGYFGTFINDTYFASILAANPLSQLNILDICVSDEGATSGRIPLSLVTVQAVLASCLSIRELRISDWSVTGEQFRSLASSIRDNNWDLTVSRKSRL